MTKTDLTMRAGLGRSMSYAEVDANLQRLMYWSGVWAAGNYEAFEVVRHLSSVWIANKDTTAEPGYTAANTDWDFFSDAVEPGYGEMIVGSPPVAGVDLDAAFHRLVYFDTINVQGPNVSFNTTTGEFDVHDAGVWEMGLSITLGHNSSNSGRVSNVRLVVAGTGLVLGTVPFGIGRNVEITSIYETPWIQILPEHLTIPLAWEIGGGGTITNVTYDSLATQIQRLH